MAYTYDRVWAEIELNNLNNNLLSIHNHIGKDKLIMAVIKTDGYGHGALPMAKLMEKLDYIWGYAVATAEEAIMLRGQAIRKPILSIGFTFPSAYEELLIRDIRITVFRKDSLLEIDRVAKRLGLIAKLHIKVDTGMGRIGILPDSEGLELIKEANKLSNVLIEGIFTHFSKADEENKAYTYEQLDRFKIFLELIKKEIGIDIPIKHCSNSAGIIELPSLPYSVVRAGIILYGIYPSKEVKRSLSLKPMLSLKSRISFIKKVKANSLIGYGGTYETKKETIIATIPVGYGDGYPRSLSNIGHVLIRGKRAPIIGRICMDQFMVDITDIREARENDEVTLIGSDGDNTISMDEICEKINMISYELSCIIGKRVPRLYTYDGEVAYVRDYFVDAPMKEVP